MDGKDSPHKDVPTINVHVNTSFIQENIQHKMREEGRSEEIRSFSIGTMCLLQQGVVVCVRAFHRKSSLNLERDLSAV